MRLQNICRFYVFLILVLLTLRVLSEFWMGARAPLVLGSNPSDLQSSARLPSTLILQFIFSDSFGSMMSIPVSRILIFFYNRRTIRKLRQLSATSPENAKTLRELGITRTEEALSLQSLQTKGRVKEIVDAKGEKRY